MGDSRVDLRAILREELASALNGMRDDVQKLQSDLAEAVTRISSLERAASPWQSPRSAMRSASSEPARKSSRGSVGFTPRAPSDDLPVSGDTFILNSFPDKTGRDEVKAWLDPLVQRLAGNVEYSLSSRSKYSSRIFMRFESPMRAKQFSAEWRKETRMYGEGAAATRIYISWKLSPSRAKEEFLHRQFFFYARDVLHLLPPKLEKEKATRTVYYDRALIARVEKEKVVLTNVGKTFATVEKFQAWLEEKERQRPSL